MCFHKLKLCFILPITIAYTCINCKHTSMHLCMHYIHACTTSMHACTTSMHALHPCMHYIHPCMHALHPSMHALHCLQLGFDAEDNEEGRKDESNSSMQPEPAPVPSTSSATRLDSTDYSTDRPSHEAVHEHSINVTVLCEDQKNSQQLEVDKCSNEIQRPVDTIPVLPTGTISDTGQHNSELIYNRDSQPLPTSHMPH